MPVTMSFKSSFFSFSVLENPSSPLISPLKFAVHDKEEEKKRRRKLRCELPQQEWRPNDRKNEKWRRWKSLSGENARHLIKDKARRGSQVRQNPGNETRSPNWNWNKRALYQMPQFLTDDRHSHKYQRHVVAAIRTVRKLDSKPPGSYNIRQVLKGFNNGLSFRDMCVVLKEQRGWRPAAEFFAWMKLQLCYIPSVIAYTILLRIYGEAGKLNLAEETFMDMLEVGCEPDEVACSTMIRAYARWRYNDDMLSFYSAVRERGILLSPTIYNYMIASLHKASMHDAALRLWEEMTVAGLKPNHFTYTLVIDLYSKQGKTDEALKMFREMRSTGLVPEETTYNIVINMIGRQGLQEDALKIFDDMRSQGIVPSNYTCASLLNLCYKSGSYQCALSIFSELQTNKFDADEVVYSILIRIYGKLGLYEVAEKTFREMEQNGHLTQEKTYVAMARVYMKAGSYDKALNVLENMQANNVMFSKFALSALLHCHVMQRSVESAEMTFQTMFTSGFSDKVAYTNMLNLYTDEGLIEKAKELIIKLRESSMEFDNELYGSIINVYCKAGMIRDAELLIKEMGVNGMLADQIPMTTLMQAYGEAGRLQDAKQVFESLEHPDSVALGLMLYFYRRFGYEDDAKVLHKKLLETSNSVSTSTEQPSYSPIYKRRWDR